MNTENGLSPLHLIAVGIAIGVIIGYFAFGGDNLVMMVSLGTSGGVVGFIAGRLLGGQTPPDDE